MNTTRKSPQKQQASLHPKNSYAATVSQPNRMRPSSSMASSYPKKTSSPTAMSASCSPAVPLFYSAAYADPPECSELPQPPESWYVKVTDVSLPVQVEEKPAQKSPRKSNPRKNYKGFNRAFYPTHGHEKFAAPFVSVRA